ncbi:MULTISPECIES: quinone-dependent dihydroorotate dehydrogenase [unclassified Staphylococcus]|uniref:quinone-dependent dihydroorotate dehydrogenase n=1 Tax=unclassified Staphylococcus TaxID=91994 RepID=UPI001881A25D|nr:MULTISPECIES: quinone-dependent dihydroorotate dehydrogenase [unclassified Staphylococcus]MBF2758097.1 quinone-dependent dihydroorotate dehydrogenase [Staphylococcus haemolyticus]MBF2773891.1 quinone-dependent dihydroorotate dehydrogenase [Staphylococcus haemolyticus]MBF2776470.1 quinone-dependent dihydroorotate dehydrogenase [Staphylococcus haemolyticus]MBF2815946.1 quinone-dependent dihydroorotate dehydrogenase [Staphylococcus haemolyticus]MBF9719334.1 quinone-dependent dihydroorotate deh
MYKLIKPLLFKFDPEKAHSMTIDALKLAQKRAFLLPVMHKLFNYEDPSLTQTIKGITFNNPIGLAAGFDKSCEVPKALENVGFGALELGGITPKPQDGNPKPRMYRLVEDNALINRMGFNNIGMNRALWNLRRHSYAIPVGLNVGVNKTTPYNDRYQDYIKVIDTFKADVSFFTVNISSPNTENLQSFHDKDEFSMLCNALKDFKAHTEVNVPIFLKLTSDLELDGFKTILPAITETFDGMILANTTRQRDGLTSANKVEDGGLSGRPLFKRNLELVKWAYQQTKGEFLIIGTGGIFSAKDAIQMMRNGASLVQIYSSLVIEGPGLTKKINKDIAAYLKQHQYNNVSDIIGLDAK